MFERCYWKDRNEWLKQRGRGIGGSDASSIVGCNKYRNNIELWAEKIKPIDEIVEHDDNQFTRYGRTCEDGIRQQFVANYYGFFEVHHNELETLVRTDKKYLRASLDGEIKVLQEFMFYGYDQEGVMLEPSMNGILECKTKDLEFGSIKEWQGKVPYSYFCQALHYFIVTDYDFIIFAPDFKRKEKNGAITNYYRYQIYLKKDFVEDMKFLEAQEDAFWENVEKKTKPRLII